MNVRLEYSYMFTAGVWLKDASPVMNSFSLTLNLVTASTDIIEQNIAFDRMNYFINEVISNSFFINEEEVETINHLQSAGIRAISLPESPYEQVVGLLLYRKLNAIMEGRIFVTDLKISSTYGQNVLYLYSGEEVDDIFDSSGWWEDPDPSWKDRQPPTRKNKIVELSNVSSTTWRDVGLQWEDEPASAEDKEKAGVERPTVGVVMKFNQDPE